MLVHLGCDIHHFSCAQCTPSLYNMPYAIKLHQAARLLSKSQKGHLGHHYSPFVNINATARYIILSHNMPSVVLTPTNYWL